MVVLQLSSIDRGEIASHVEECLHAQHRERPQSHSPMKDMVNTTMVYMYVQIVHIVHILVYILYYPTQYLH